MASNRFSRRLAIRKNIPVCIHTTYPLPGRPTHVYFPCPGDGPITLTAAITRADITTPTLTALMRWFQPSAAYVGYMAWPDGKSLALSWRLNTVSTIVGAVAHANPTPPPTPQPTVVFIEVDPCASWPKVYTGTSLLLPEFGTITVNKGD